MPVKGSHQLIYFTNWSDSSVTKFPVICSCLLFVCCLFSLQGVSAGTSGANAMAEALLINQTLQTLE